MSRVHTPVPAVRHVRTGSAHPPLTGVKPTSQWYRERMSARPRPWWKRVLRIGA